MSGKGMTKAFLENRKKSVLKHIKEDKVYDMAKHEAEVNSQEKDEEDVKRVA